MKQKSAKNSLHYPLFLMGESMNQGNDHDPTEINSLSSNPKQHDGPIEREAEPNSLEDLENEIAELAAHIDAATWRMLRAISEFDRRCGWEGGFLTCSHWLSWRTGMDRVTAREKVRVARALDHLPRISQALRKGRIGYSKVRAMVRIATPENEGELLRIALDGTAGHVEKLVRAYRKANHCEDIQEVRRQHEERYLKIYTDQDGMVVIQGRLPPESGALVKKALDAAMADIREKDRNKRTVKEDTRIEDARHDSAESSCNLDFCSGSDSTQYDKILAAPSPHDSPESPDGTATRSEHDSAESSETTIFKPSSDSRPSSTRVETYEQTCAAALGLLAETALGRGLGSTVRGEPYQVVIHVDADVLADPHMEGSAEMDNGEGISGETCRRLACDAPEVAVTHGPAGDLLHTGRKTRRISTPLWRALSGRDRTCRFPGCSRTGKLQAHHIKHWAGGGKTSPDNLVLLCTAHHWAVHEGGYQVRGQAPHALTFLRPDGRILPAVPEPAALPEDPVQGLKASNRNQGLHITADTPACNWDGEPMDLDMASAGIMECPQPAEPAGPV